MPDLESRPSICAVIVTYHPDVRNTERLLQSVYCQTSQVVVVDNGSPSDTIRWLQKEQCKKRVVILQNGENLGIAAGHNKGIDVCQDSCRVH